MELCNRTRAALILWSLVGVCALTLAPAWAQTPEEIEKRIANLPPGEKAYERFRLWFESDPNRKHIPAEVERDYHAYLKARGFSDAEIAAQDKAIDVRQARDEAERWNKILTSNKSNFNTQPNAFLVEIAKGRKPGTVLDVGMGQGRNSIWLAQQGWDVTGFDPAEKAVALARENAQKLGVHINTEIKGWEDFDFGENRWDMIVLSYVGGRGMTDVIQRSLKPGGILVVEAFHRDATKDGPIGGLVVFDTAEVPSLFPKLRVVRYEEPVADADFGKIRVRVVRYCGERPE
jgi:predicted O-methyltransferase YrrM